MPHRHCHRHCLRLRKPEIVDRLRRLAEVAVWVALPVALLTSACSGRSAAADVPDPGARVIGCDAEANHPTRHGTLVNNQWNRASAPPGAWRQCLQSRERDGRTEFGWFWEWPTRDGLYAYPEILVGRSPWKAAPSNDPRFPRSVAATRRLTIDYDIESRSGGKKNLAAELWLTDKALPAGPPDPRSIKVELMIWTDASPGMVSARDQPVATIEVDGRAWRVFVKRHWGDASGGSGHTWTFVIYQATTNTPTARYDARKFLQDAIDRGLVAPGDVIAGVELGNEITSGSGSTWLRRFDVEVD